MLPEANFQDMDSKGSILAIEIRNESGNMEIEHQVLVDKYVDSGCISWANHVFFFKVAMYETANVWMLDNTYIKGQRNG